MDPLVVDIIVTVLAYIAYFLAIAGIIVPVLPGTITIAIATLVWAFVIGGPVGWFTFGVVLVLCVIGISVSYILTGSRLKAAKVPNWPIVWGVIGAIIGFFAIPVLGFPIGFIVGLFLAEWKRQGDAAQARTTTVVALKALGIGILIELGLAFLSLVAFTIGNIIYFLNV